MPDLSGSAATIRQTYQAVTNPFINIVPLEVFATANVNGTPTFPTAQLTVDGASADWASMVNQMYVRVTRAGALIGQYAVRKPTDGSTTVIYIANINEGDSGVALLQATSIQDNDVVTVYKHIVPTSYFSRIDPDTGEFYKQYDIGWLTLDAPFNERTKEPAPVVNMGSHRHIRIAPAGTAAWEMTGATSYSWFGNAVNYLWTLPTGVSFGGVSVDTDETVDLEAGAGWYRIRLRGEDDSTGKRDGSFRYVFVTDGDDFRAFSEDFGCKITSDIQTRVGRAITLEVKASRGTDVMSRLYNSAPVLITYDHLYSSDKWATVDAAPNGLVENFFGYIRSYEQISTSTSGVDTYRVLIESPLMYYAALPVAAQTILANATPDSWATVALSLSHVAFFASYILNYHAGALATISDMFISDLDEFFRGALSVPATNILNAVQKAVGLCLGANIGCTSNGAIYMRRHGSYETSTWRDALTTVWTWEAGDIVGELGYTYNPLMEVSETDGAGTVSSTTIPPVKIRARAGLFAGMQGLGVPNTEGFIGASSDDIRDRIGHQHQRTNAPVKGVSFTPRGGHDFIEPALMEWHELNLDAYDPGDMGVVNNTRVLPLQVTRNWDYTPRGLRMTQSVTMEPETMGARAPLVPASLIGSPLLPGAAAAACPTLNITWVSEGATPAEWSGLSGQDPFDPGTLTGFTPGSGTIDQWAGSRSANTNWTAAINPAALGVMYTFAAACTLTHAEATFTWTATANTKVVHFLALVNGVWTDIKYQVIPSGSGTSGATITWTGSVVATKLIFAAVHGNPAATIDMTISKINSP